MTKQELRKLYFKKRLSLTDEDYHFLNNQLIQRFFLDVNCRDLKVVHSYLPIPSNKEPDTRPIINHIRKEFPLTRISIPRVQAGAGTLENVYFSHNIELKANSWNIEEPVGGVLTSSHDIDMVLVPLLCFDRVGNRIGYGKGYYDRFLRLCRTDCTKIGLSLFDPVEKISDVDKFDVPLNYCVTPERTYSF